MNTSQRHTAVMVGLIVGAIVLFAGGGAAYYHLYVPRTETIWHAINRMDAADVKRHLRRDITQGFRYREPMAMTEFTCMIGEHRQWPITWAVTWGEEGAERVVRALLSFGCDVDARDRDGPTAFLIVTGYNDVRMMRFLLDAGADMDVRMVSRIYDGRGIFFDREDSESSAPASGEAERKAPRIWEPPAPFVYEANALHYALENAAVDAVAFLLDRGMDADGRWTDSEGGWYEDASNWRPLHTLAFMAERASGSGGMFGDPEGPISSDYTRCARLLLERGAEINARDERGRTPLDFLTDDPHNRYEELRALLVSHGGKTGEELGPYEPPVTDIFGSHGDAQP